MFQDNLFTIELETSQDGASVFVLNFRSDHPMYSGHFPGQPITPGVVWVEIVKNLITLVSGSQYRMKTLRQIKFLSAHQPDEHPEVEIRIHQTRGDDLQVQAEGVAAVGVLFRMSAVYQIL